MPHSARSSSTSRYDNAKRRYQRTERMITSGGKQKPAKANPAMERRRRRGLMAVVCLLGPHTAGATVPVEDPDTVTQRAIDAGAQVEIPVQEMFWGERYGVLRDPFGHRWAVSTAREQISPDAIAHRTPPDITHPGVLPAFPAGRTPAQVDDHKLVGALVVSAPCCGSGCPLANVRPAHLPQSPDGGHGRPAPAEVAAAAGSPWGPAGRGPNHALSGESCLGALVSTPFM